MKKILFASLVAAGAAFAACSSDGPLPEPGDTPVIQGPTRSMTVEAYLENFDSNMTRAQAGPIADWASGDEIGLFLSSGELGNPYLGKADYSNVKVTFSNQGWQMDEVLLGEPEANVFAYYPWKNDVDPTALDVKLDQTDYLYGQSDAPVSYTSRNAKIAMHHALTQFVVYFTRGSYKKPGVITNVQVKNMHSAENIVNGGKLNLATGKVTGGEVTAVELFSGSETLPDKSSNVNFCKLLVPFGALAAAGDVRLQLTIDGVDFYFDFAKNTEWKAGYRNVYRATINSNSLEIGKDDITIEPWVDEEDKDAEFKPLQD